MRIASTLKVPSDVHVHWTKDFVEHLRSVHFALVVVSLAILIIARSPEPSEYVEAERELALIRRLDPNRLESQMKDRLLAQEAAYHIADAPEGFALRHSDLRGSRYEAALVTSNGGLPNSQIVVGVEGLAATESSARAPDERDAREFGSRDYGSQEFGSYAEFAAYWNEQRDHPNIMPVKRLNDLYFCKSPPGSTQIFVDGVCKRTNFTLAPTDHELSENTFIEPRKCEPNFSFPCNGSFWFGEYNDGAIVFTSHEFGPELDTGSQQELMRSIGQEWPWSRSAHDSFPALEDLTQGLQNLSLSELQQVLASKKRQAAQQFEAFGLKFPTEVTRSAALLTILGIQLYFFLHLHQLTPRLKEGDAGWEVAWIGVYRSLVAKCVMFVTVVATPTIAISALLYLAMHYEPASQLIKWQFYAGVPLVVAMSALVFAKLPMWRNVEADVEDPPRISGAAC